MNKRTTPKSQSILGELHALLNDAVGLHNRMAKEAGVPQTVVSRTFQGAAEPRLTSAEKMLVWLRANRHRFDAMRKEAAVARRSTRQPARQARSSQNASR